MREHLQTKFFLPSPTKGAGFVPCLVGLGILTTVMGGCSVGDNEIQLVACVEGREIADLREYCMAPSGEWDYDKCSEVVVNLRCDDAVPNAVIYMRDFSEDNGNV